MEEFEPPKTIRHIEFAPRTIVWLIAAIGMVWLAWQLWTVIVVVLVALVLVGTFDPLVGWLERRGLKRGRALALIFVGVALLFAAIMLMTIPPLFSQLQHMIENAPDVRRRLVVFLSAHKWAAPFAKTVKSMPLDDLMLDAGNVLLSYSTKLMTLIGYSVTTMVLAIYLLADPTRAKGLVFALVPRHHHVKFARIVIELKTIVGAYMRGQVITSVAITIFTFALLTVFRVDDALALAMFAGLTDVIPFIGGYVASAPAIISVSGDGAAAIAIVTVLMFGYQEFESRILVPRVYGHTLRMAPAIVLLALLVGGTLLGILGALLALPIAAGLQMLVRQLRVELPGEPLPDERIRARDEKAERVYEKLTQGESVADAAVIAGQLAASMKKTEDNGGRVTAEIESIDPPLARPQSPEPEPEPVKPDGAAPKP